MNPVRRLSPVILALTLLTLAGASPAKKARPMPGLGQFTAPVTLSGVIPGSGVPFTWIGTITLSPAGSEVRRTISGTGLFTTLPVPGPTPVPVPTPTPTPTPVPPPVPTPTPAPTPGPVPVPVNAINVKSFGALGNDTADDTAACQRALQSARAGDTVYFPAGVYKLSDQLKWNHPPQATIIGDGPTSVLHSVGGQGIYIGTGGESGGPVTVTRIKFQGTPGGNMINGKATGGIQIFGPQNTVVDNVDFADVTTAVYDAAPTSGTVTRNCRVNGWARICFFVEKNGQVTNCKLFQNDPNPAAAQTSHCFYVHGAASNVLIADNEVSGVAKYFLQEYSESPNTLTSGLQVRRCYVHDCQNGVVLAHSQMGAGDIFNTVIDSCVFKNIVGGSAILIKDGNGVVVSNNTVDTCVSYGIGLGGWAPYEPNFSISNVDVFGNTVTRCSVGLFGLASNGGSFSNCRFHGNAVSGNRSDLSIQSVLGLSYSPTGPRPPRMPRN